MRGSRFYYRRRVPLDARRLIDRSEIWRSLRTDSLKTALRRLPSAIAQVEADFEQARWMAGLSCDRTLFEPSPHDAERRSAATTKASPCEGSIEVAGARATTFGEAYKGYLADPTQAWSPRTREAYETSRRLAVSVIGENTPLSALSRAHCREYVDVLRFLPRNAAKRYPKLTARQAADRARAAGGGADIISAARPVRPRCNRLRLARSTIGWAC